MHNSKSENKLGYFKTKLLKPISPLYFNDKERTTALLSLCSILNVLLPEAQPNEKIYKSFFLLQKTRLLLQIHRKKKLSFNFIFSNEIVL